jgi:hypothetical protein
LYFTNIDLTSSNILLLFWIFLTMCYDAERLKKFKIKMNLHYILNKLTTTNIFIYEGCIGFVLGWLKPNKLKVQHQIGKHNKVKLDEHKTIMEHGIGSISPIHVTNHRINDTL